jgi:hypothetical protein
MTSQGSVQNNQSLQARPAPLASQTASVNQLQQKEQESAISMPVRVILAAFIVGVLVLILAVAEIVTHNHAVNTLLEHLSSACIVASILGLTYENLAHKKRQGVVNQVVNQVAVKHREQLMEAFNVFIKLTPRTIFELLKDIASKGEKIPTLYRPARQSAEEYTFADSIDYFDSLFKLGKEDIILELESWLKHPNNRNLKFLASDFIGKYRLDELKNALDTNVDYRLNEWAIHQSQGQSRHPEPSPIIGGRKFWDGFWSAASTQEDFGWLMNYIWASSRCEEPMYTTLEELLLTTQNETMQEWILFIPQQMPEDVRFLEILQRYLARPEPSPSVNCLKLIVRAVGKMESLKVQRAKKIFYHSAEIFNTDELKNEIRAVWQSHRLKPHSLIASIERLSGNGV